MATKKNSAQIVIPPEASVWHHELQTARALASAGYVVTFLTINDRRYAKSPDIIIDNETWEIKAPCSDKLSAIERNLKRATKQSQNVIIDSHRMRKLHDSSIQSMLIQKYRQQKTLKRLFFVNRKREVVDISTLIR